MRNNFYLLLMILISIFSCKKEESGYNYYNGDPDPDCDHHVSNYGATFLIDTLMRNFKFKPGTYWVYYDSISNNIDSQYVISKDEKMITSCDKKFETYVFQIKSSSNSKFSIKNYFVNVLGLGKGYNGSSDFSGLGKKIFSNPTWSMTNTTVIYDSLQIYDSTYYKVKKITIPNEPDEGGKKSTYYVNAKYGILRHDLFWHGSIISRKVMIRKNIIR
jgi:hypothetical protein